MSGVVLDNTNISAPGVTVGIPGTSVASPTDTEGRFFLEPAPVGAIYLKVDSTTATRPGDWSSLKFEMVTILGRVHTLGVPVYILAIDMPGGVFVSETQGGTLMLAEIPGFEMEITPGSATWPDGSCEGNVSVTLVHSDKAPMVPNFGQQPRMMITVQPEGVVFDPLARLTYPNLETEAPGATVEMYSFDHDTERFVSLGRGRIPMTGC